MLVANFYPNKITVTSKRVNTHTRLIDSWLKKYHAEPTQKKDGTPDNFVNAKKTTLDLSANSVRELRNSVNSLVFLSQPRTVYSPSKKPIYNFRASFVTLTLPSVQKHSDVEIKKCLDLFLQDLRRVYKVKNYVWRSELQNNGNLHFHLVFDVYIHHKVIRNYWLKALRNTGYVQEYQRKFLNMSFTDYKRLRAKADPSALQNPIEFHKKVVRGYATGQRSSWLSPNCVDVRNIYNVNQISAYVSKYMAKESRKTQGSSDSPVSQTIPPDRIEAFGKVWGRSSSLSRLKYKFPIVLDSVQHFITKLVESGSVMVKVYDWATIYYFQFEKMPLELFQSIRQRIFDTARTWRYPFQFS